MKELQLLRGHDGREVRILDSLAADWEKIAIAIGLETSDINVITRNYPDNVFRACMELFNMWLSHEYSYLQAPTWNALHCSLLEAEFIFVANEIAIILSH